MQLNQFCEENGWRPVASFRVYDGDDVQILAGFITSLWNIYTALKVEERGEARVGFRREDDGPNGPGLYAFVAAPVEDKKNGEDRTNG